MIVLEEHVVTEVAEATRISDYAVGIFKMLPTRKGVKKALKSGAILLNGQSVESGRYIQRNDLLQLVEVERKNRTLYPLKIPVLYEDDTLAILNKPSGIPVSGNSYRNVDNCLPYNLDMPEKNASAVMPVHRLDAATQGILVIGKTRNAVIHLGQQFAEGNVEKTYHAIVHGPAAEAGMIALKIDGKESLSHWKLIDQVAAAESEGQFSGFSLLELSPKTGRTHQLRKHLKAIGHPIVGDKLYNESGKTYLGKGLFLAATAISFLHPSKEEAFNIGIEVPNKFASFLAYQKRRVDQYKK